MSYRQENIQLLDLAEIQGGMTVRSRLSEDSAGGLEAVQLGDLLRSDAFLLSSASKFHLEGKVERYRVRDGDLLFRSRGDRNTAAVVVGSADETAVAVSPLIIIRPRAEVVLPEYLAWFINQTPSQLYFDSCARGTSLRMISRKDLDQLQVSVPDFEKQKLIVNISKLATQEQFLLQQLAEKKKEYLDFVLL
ncbi:restriction endonuclease subunit S [Pseudovibrio sp. Ad26]|uniref:restriction endonuclease subunit S n=1 Tax=Pseudovibrio sp. Ad26 TaxID=989410 RepID=UPI0012902E09|nr:restriction endonuclease subunit S [Pseudovibrio sp. Ad26]